MVKELDAIAAAIPWKPYLGTHAYDLFVFKAILMGELKDTHFDVEVDGIKYKSKGEEDVKAIGLMITNHNKIVKRAMNFPGVPNDGLMEVQAYPFGTPTWKELGGKEREKRKECLIITPPTR